MKICDFVLDKVNKDYFLPSIQREFVWLDNRDDKKVEKLFDSLLQGYPIGSILEWEFPKELEKNKLAFEVYEFINNYDEENPHNTEANLNGITKVNLVLDGQQRLTALFMGLKGSYAYKYRKKSKTTKLYINLFSNIENNVDNTYGLKYDLQFLESPNGNDNELWFEIGLVLDYKGQTAEDFKEAYDHIIKKASASPDLIKKAKNILGRVHSVFCDSEALNIVPVHTEDEEKILNIFVRTNEGGVPLEKADLLLSYMESNKEIFQPKGARREIFDFVDELNAETVGKPEYGFTKDDVLKASLVLSDLDVQYKLVNFNKVNLKKIDEKWTEIKKYLKQTVDLLAIYGFSKKNITSKNALVPIAYYLMKNKKSEAFINSQKNDDVTHKGEIIRWLVISLLKKGFGSSSDSTLQRMRKGINDGKKFPDLIEGQSIQRATVEEWVENEEYLSRYSHLLLMLISPQKHWDLCHQDHIYPKSKFDDKEYSNMKLTDKQISQFNWHKNSIANLQLLNPSINLAKTAEDFIDWQATQNKEFLEDMLIPKSIDYSFKNFVTFVEKRQEKIVDRLATILKVEP